MTRVAFFHPDLGIGGAERLIIEIALAIKENKNDVTIFTSHHDKKHCFSETIDGKLRIISRGDWIPRSVFGGFMAYLAALRVIYLCIYFLIFEQTQFDVVILDQISIMASPFLKLFRLPVIFYCHYPDQLLSARGGCLKNLYRTPINCAESFCASCSDVVLVNSNFTQNAVLNTFLSLKNDYKKNPNKIKVVYPCIASKTYNIDRPLIPLENVTFKYIFVSINRFETKKCIKVALEAMVMLKSVVSEDVWLQTHLALIGGYDSRLSDNVSCYEKLSTYAKENNLLSDEKDKSDRVSFICNPCDSVKIAYLQRAIGFLYTPENEHFGIAPVEAMMLGIPVIACNSGGPLESVVDKITGFLGPQSPDHFCSSMKILIEDENTRKDMSKHAQIHANKHFTERSLKESMISVFKQLHI